MSDFQKWWDETYGQILTITNDPDADASCRIAKIAAMDAWKAATEALEAERDALRKDAERYRFIKDDRIVLAGGPWPVAPFGEECDRKIDAAIVAKEPK